MEVAILTDCQTGSARARRLQEATAGLSNHATWYQYGFGRPQGPTGNRAVTGEDIRVVANFILERAGIRPPDEPIDIIVFSRTRNRRILNEVELLGRAAHPKRPGVEGAGLPRRSCLLPALPLKAHGISQTPSWKRIPAGGASWSAWRRCP